MKAHFLLPVLAILFFSCKKNKSDKGTPAILTKTYAFDSDANSTLMFKDGEAMADMTAEARRFKIGQVLRVKAVDATTIEVANFAPVDIADATVLLRLEGREQPVRLLHISKVRAHARQVITYPFVEGQALFQDTKGQTVDLSSLKASGIAPASVSFGFTGETELIKKLKLLGKLNWEVKYHDFDAADNPADNWKETPDARDFRRFSGLIINLAYLFQSEQTKTAFVNEIITDNNQVEMTAAQKQAAFEKIQAIPRFNCGIVVNVSGLGGGATFGVANHVLHDYLTKDVSFIAVHEIGHMIGYSHNSTMTYPVNNRGAVVATGKVYQEMVTKKELPVQATNYYMPGDL